jgi:hypothetical protein
VQLFTLKKGSKKHEKITCAKSLVKHQIFVGFMAKTQLLKITKHYLIEFDQKKNAEANDSNQHRLRFCLAFPLF